MGNREFYISLKKSEGKLVPLQEHQKEQFKDFVSKIPDGEIVHVYYESVGKKGTHPQIAKIHAGLKALSDGTGTSFEDLKLILKKKSGLIIEDKARSFSTCSKEELAYVIQVLTQWGQEYGFML